jgi:hypothetical protein
MTLIHVLVFTLIVFMLLYFKFRGLAKTQSPLPPGTSAISLSLHMNENHSLKGPKSYLIIGNLLQIPRMDMGKAYARWGMQYGRSIMLSTSSLVIYLYFLRIGPIIYMRVFKQEFIIFNTAKAALDLFDQCGAIYSNRPHLVMARELVGRGKSVLFHQYNDSLCEHRKLLRNALNAQRAATYWQMQEIESYRLMATLLQCPDDFISLLQR